MQGFLQVRVVDVEPVFFNLNDDIGQTLFLHEQHVRSPDHVAVNTWLKSNRQTVKTLMSKSC